MLKKLKKLKSKQSLVLKNESNIDPSVPDSDKYELIDKNPSHYLGAIKMQVFLDLTEAL